MEMNASASIQSKDGLEKLLSCVQILIQFISFYFSDIFHQGKFCSVWGHKNKRQDLGLYVIMIYKILNMLGGYPPFLTPLGYHHRLTTRLQYTVVSLVI